MRVVRHWGDFPEHSRLKGTVILIGSFDGLHIGHQALIQMAKLNALTLNLPLILITFEPSPKNYFAKQAQRPINKLLAFYDTYQVLNKMGIDAWVILKFNAAMLNLTPEDFLDKLSCHLNPKVYCLGQDFQFGKNRSGDIETIQQYAARHNQSVQLLSIIKDIYKDKLDSEPLKVSSTLLRSSLAAGDLLTARRLLNHAYRLSGKVSFGKKLGRSIGFRTANINLKNCPIPLRGVYVVRVCQIEQTAVNYRAVANIGVRPTLHQDNILMLEVHLLDQNQEQNLDLYGKRIEIEFIQKIRDEKKFNHVDSLKKQIEEDVQAAKLII